MTMFPRTGCRVLGWLGLAMVGLLPAPLPAQQTLPKLPVLQTVPGVRTAVIPGQETRSPDDFELFLEGILEKRPPTYAVPASRNGSAACGLCGSGCLPASTPGRQMVPGERLTRLQGTWLCGEDRFTIEGNRWSWGNVAGTLQWVSATADVESIDLLVTRGITQGQTCRAIVRLEGNTLHYCDTYHARRPGEFKTANGNFYFAWQRAVR